jgi:hypothetical protein
VRRSLLGGRVTARAAGDAGSPDLDINSDVRGARAAFPGHGLLSFFLGRTGGATSFGGRRLPQQQTPGPWYSPGGPGSAYGGGWADGILTVRDRHIMTRFGTVRNPRGGGSSMPSADLTHPVPPRYQMVNTTESWQVGTDHTTNLDNTGVHNSVPVAGTAKRFPLGTQDGTMTLVMGPPIGEWRQYGVRGPRGMHGPDPDVWDPNWIPANGAGGGGGRGRMTQAGAPGMQPADRRFVWGGVPHGLHSPTAQSTQWTAARFASTKQQQPPRVDRPASSRIAGQSMSQFYPPEGGQGIGQAPRMQNPGRSPGLLSRFMART